MEIARSRCLVAALVCALTGLAFAAGRALADAPAPAFVPIPKITTDPNSGTTVGVLPTWLVENEDGRIHRIIAPDIQHNTYFGWGAHGRLLDYPSDKVQWSAVVGVSEHVRRKIDLESLSSKLAGRR